MEIVDLAQLVVYGIVHGTILALGAIGVSLIFGVLRFAHFAHGDMMSLGAYFALILVAGLGWPLWASLPFAMAGCVLVSVAIDQTIYRRLRRTAPVILLISSYGMALVIRSVIQMVWGPQDHVYETGIQMPLRLGGVAIRQDHIVIILGAVALVLALELFLRKTRAGKAMRALSDNRDLARASGINAERVAIWTWVLGGGLAAAAGMFLALDTRLHPTAGWSLLLPIFAAAILGGIGRIDGAILGGFVVGIAQEVSTAFINPAYKPAVAFSILVLMLIARPAGLLRGRL